MITYLFIALGSALGGMLRYLFSNLTALLFGEAFPLGTLLVNVTGSFLIGLFAGFSDHRFFGSENIRLFFMTGICGGYTTFSSFSLQTFNLMREGAMLKAGANIGLSVMLCMLAVWLGFLMAGRQ